MHLDLRRSGVVAPVPVDPAGLSGPTPGQARGPHWRRTSANMFVPRQVDSSATAQRIVEAIAALPAGCAVTGWAALHWQGAAWFDGTTAAGEPLPVPIATGDQVGLRARPGARLCHGWLFDDDIGLIDGLPITRPERSIYAAVHHARGLEAAVQAVSMVCYSDLLALEELAAYAVRLSGRPHVRRLSKAIALADENLWSPMEATMLVHWLRAGHPRPLCNQPIWDHRGRHLLTPDLLDPIAGVLGQYDGAVHDVTKVRRRDLTKEDACRELGLEVVTMISTDLRDLSGFTDRLDRAYRRAATRPRSGGWTIDPPPGTVDLSTVAARRALSEEDRRWLLRGRAA